jgi:hypothetical protein
MSGEDVYDLVVWCHICDEPHTDCEPADLRYQCFSCQAFIEFDEECACDGLEHCPAHCPNPHTDHQREGTTP